MNILSFIQIGIAVLLVAAVLLQQRGAGLGAGFGAEGGGFYATRRGLQQKLYWLTIILGILFVALALANLFL